MSVHSHTLSHSRASLLARAFASPCLGCEPKAKVATLLGLGSLECFEALLVHQHVAFPIFRGHRVDFFGGHCCSCLFGELGLSCPCHNFHGFVGFLPILVGGDKCEQFRATPFLGAFEINTKFFSFRGCTMCTLF